MRARERDDCARYGESRVQLLLRRFRHGCVANLHNDAPIGRDVQERLQQELTRRWKITTES
ncbi:hypothetical protein E2986_12001 [Frieseomelitta varia]|uniref:Uncharacterized protein n=1 Tax=Frieseomelitta varia TaxID=561572 RepID=A0A833RJ64_9HYME|nr:hypothetical protein E2986_12001 [Frieseomelitta varia]